MNPVYLETARLLTQVAPLVFVDDTFALKGGTAINLFVRDMPRLSLAALLADTASTGVAPHHGREGVPRPDRLTEADPLAQGAGCKDEFASQDPGRRQVAGT
jgi:hypothetical protein